MFGKGVIIKHVRALDCGVYIKHVAFLNEHKVKLKVQWLNLGENVYKISESGKKIKRPYFLEYHQTIQIKRSDFSNWVVVDL